MDASVGSRCLSDWPSVLLSPTDTKLPACTPPTTLATAHHAAYGVAHHRGARPPSPDHRRAGDRAAGPAEPAPTVRHRVRDSPQVRSARAGMPIPAPDDRNHRA